MENKKFNAKKLIIALSLVLIIALSFFAGFLTYYLTQSRTQRILSEVLSNIDDHSVYNADELPDADQVARILTGVMLSDDKYAAYYSESDYEKVVSEGEGSFVGIGVSFSLPLSELPYVFSVTLNSPAYESGILDGDLLKGGFYDGEEFTTFNSTQDAVDFLKRDGLSLTLRVDRAGEFTDKDFKTEKTPYTASYVSYADSDSGIYFIDGKENKDLKRKPENIPTDTAYISLQGFTGNAFEQFKGAMETLKNKGKSKLILDLRGNGGGYMNTLLDIASYLIDNGGKRRNLISVSKGKDGEDEFSTKANNFNRDIKKICVLADGDTASASECLIGAMLYYGDSFDINNLIVEKNDERGDYSTYGKGIMQTTYTLKTGGAIKLTTAKIYQPDGKTCIHGVGIVPLRENCVEKGDALTRALDII